MKAGKRGGTAKRIIIGTITMVIPGGIMVLFTVPVSGEAELTLGVGGYLSSLCSIKKREVPSPAGKGVHVAETKRAF